MAEPSWGDVARDRNREDIGAWRNRPKRSIWDDDDDEDDEENPSKDYKYRKPRGTDMPQNKGNSFWSGPRAGHRWGEDPNDARTGPDGYPEGTNGSVRYGGLIPSMQRKMQQAADQAKLKPQSKKVMVNGKWRQKRR